MGTILRRLKTRNCDVRKFLRIFSAIDFPRRKALLRDLTILLIGAFICYLSIWAMQERRDVEVLEKVLIFDDSGYNRTVAKYIATQVRLLCMITTIKENHLSKARHIAATWLKRCTKYIFISSETDLSLPSIHFDVPEGHENLWGKTRAAFKYAYDFHFDRFDWFLKADDDTYVIIENLRLFLLTQKPEEPVYLGCRLKKFVKGGYMQGGAGYVISRGALKAFAEKALPDSQLCRQDNRGNEDVEMGRCLQNIGVRIIDSRDSAGHHRFLALHPLKYLTASNKTNDFWLPDYSYDEILQGPECCSKYAIAFHYMEPQQLYLMEYLIYHLNVYGLREEVNTDLEREEAITRALSLSASLNFNKSIEIITPDTFGDSSS